MKTNCLKSLLKALLGLGLVLSFQPVFAAETAAQVQAPIHVVGKIVDQAGQPIIGAAVLVKGDTMKGTTTDLDGNFEINVAADAVFSVSCIGYASQEIAVNGRAQMTITLSEDTEMLEETIVVGYGTQKKVNVSGAVASVKMDEVLGDRPQPNVAGALQGAIPGLMISSGSNTPGQTGKSIQIRGTASFSGNSKSTSAISPLILIDNVPGDIDSLNPEDIESVSVLKDASASAIYGARAAAGVVLITTKRPKKAEKISVNYSGNMGLVSAISTPKQVSLDRFLQVWNEGFGQNSGYYSPGSQQDIAKWIEYYHMFQNGDTAGLASYGTLYDGGILVDSEDGKRYFLDDTDIYSRMMETGTSWNHNVALSGASEKIRFRLSANSYNENGPLYGAKDTYDRNVISGFVSADVTNWLTEEVDIYYTQQKRVMVQDVTGKVYAANALQFLPDDVADPINGILYETPKNLLVLNNAANVNIDAPRIFSKTILKPFKGFQAVFEYTYSKKQNNYRFDSGNLTTQNVQLATAHLSHDYSIARNSYEYRNAINAYATYQWDIAQKHHFSVMGGFNQESWYYAYFNTRAEDQAVLEFPSMSNAQGIIETKDEYKEFATRSGFARLNYNYDEKYILEISGRYDGSSKFPKASRFGFFPSFSVAWNAASEPWLEDVQWLTQLKPRFSYGSIGNQTSVGYYDYIASMSLDTTSNVWLDGNDEGYVTTISKPGIVSDQFTWETITTTNLGVDFGLFNNKLTGTFELFRRDVTDILSESVALPAVLGDTAPMQNVGALRTNGWEFNIAYKGNIGSKVQWNASFNIWDYTSKITKLNFNEAGSLSYLYVGKTAGEIWGYLYDGFYEVDDFDNLSTWTLKEGVTKLTGYDPRPGDYKFKNLRDLDKSSTDENEINDGMSTVSQPGDRVVIGNSTPRFQYGLNLGLSYAGFDLSVILQGVGLRQNWISTVYNMTANDNWAPIYEGTDYYWTPKSTDSASPDYYVNANPDAKLFRIYNNFGNRASNIRNSDLLLSDTSYLRVKNATLSYAFPKKWISRIGLEKLRVYASAENLFTFSSLPAGIDPETLAWEYPLFRTISFGLNITL